MLIHNQVSLEELRRTIDYGFYYRLSNEQEQKRLEILADYNKRLTRLRPQLTNRLDLEQSLKLGFSNWRLFTGIISKVKHLTQPHGEDDYCILAYDGKTKFLYLAKEIFSGPLSQEDLSVFLFSQLTGTRLSNNESNRLFGPSYQRQAEFTQKLLADRVVPYQLTNLLEALLDGIVDEKLHEFRNKIIDPKRAEIHAQNIQKILQGLISTRPRSIRNFTTHLEQSMSRKEPFSIYDLTDKLGEIGVLNARMHILLRALRKNLIEGDLEELQYNYLDFTIILKYLSADGKFCDEWIRTENQEFMQDYQEFLTQTRKYLEQSSEEYDSAIQAGNTEEAKQLTANLIDMKKYFSVVIDPDTKSLVEELDSVIEKMNS